MKFLIVFLLSVISLFAKAQENIENRAELLLHKLKSKTITDNEVKELTKIAFDVQNRGQILDESQHDYKESMKLISRAIFLFHVLEDTLSEANNRKFKGYLLGRFEKFAEAKTEIQKATTLYLLKSNKSGVAVSQFDLSRVYEFENKIDSAIYYCTISLDYWKFQNVTSRIFNVNNMLLHLLIKSKKTQKAVLIQKESWKLLQDSKFHWQDAIDFYFLSKKLYEKEAKVSHRYKMLYDEKIADLKKKGISARSYYDNN